MIRRRPLGYTVIRRHTNECSSEGAWNTYRPWRSRPLTLEVSRRCNVRLVGVLGIKVCRGHCRPKPRTRRQIGVVDIRMHLRASTPPTCIPGRAATPYLGELPLGSWQSWLHATSPPACLGRLWQQGEPLSLLPSTNYSLPRMHAALGEPSRSCRRRRMAAGQNRGGEPHALLLGCVGGCWRRRRPYGVISSYRRTTSPRRFEQATGRSTSQAIL